MVAEDDPLFVQFWERFPRRVAKKDARIAWAALNPSPEIVARMVMTLTWQATSADWLRDGGRYVPYPASWIRGQRWQDEQDKLIAGTTPKNLRGIEEWLNERT